MKAFEAQHTQNCIIICLASQVNMHTHNVYQLKYFEHLKYGMEAR